VHGPALAQIARTGHGTTHAVVRVAGWRWEMKVLGMVLIVLGVVGLLYGGITWTRRDKVVDLGPIEVTQNKHERMPISPIAGGVCVVVGATLLLAGKRVA